MKATLIVTNIHGLYTMAQQNHRLLCIHNAFVAMHHAHIIDYGNHDWHHWADKDTRIVDASNEIVVPAFIDIHVSFSHQAFEGDRQRVDQESVQLFYRNGITTLVTDALPSIASTPFYDLRKGALSASLPLVDYENQSLPAWPKPFILTTSFAHETRPFYDMLPLASMLYLRYPDAGERLLQAMTNVPAQAAGLKKQGAVRRGYYGNLLVFQARDLHELFYSFGCTRLHRIIHRGVHIHPHIII